MAASIRKLFPFSLVLIAALALAACGGESESEQLPPTITPDPRISELQTAVTGHQGRLEAAESENAGQATAIVEGQASVEAVIAVDRAEAAAHATEVAQAIGTAQADGAHSAGAYATISAATAIAQASAIAELDQSHSENTSADQTAVAAIENNLDAQATAASANATAIAAQGTEIAAMETQTGEQADAANATAAALATADAELAASADATAAALATADAELASRTDATIAAESASAQATAAALATAQAEQAAALATADAEQAARFDATAAAEQAAREEGDAAQATALAEQEAKFDATIAADQTQAAENVAAQETALAEQGARFDATIAAKETAEATARAQIERTISALSTDVTPEVDTGNPDSVPRTPTPSSRSVGEPDVTASTEVTSASSAESGSWRIEVGQSWIDTSLTDATTSSAPVPYVVLEVTLTNMSGSALELPIGALVLTDSDGSEFAFDPTATLIAQQSVASLPNPETAVLQPGQSATLRIAFSVPATEANLYLTWSIASLAAGDDSGGGIGSAFAIPVPVPLAARPEDAS